MKEPISRVKTHFLMSESLAAHTPYYIGHTRYSLRIYPKNTTTGVNFLCAFLPYRKSVNLNHTGTGSATRDEDKRSALQLPGKKIPQSMYPEKI